MIEKVLNNLDYKLVDEKKGGFGKLCYVITNKEFNSLEKNSKILNCQFLEKYLDIVITENWFIFRKYSKKIKKYYLQVVKISPNLKDEELELKLREELDKKILGEEYGVISDQNKFYDVYENKFLEEGTVFFPDEITLKFFHSHII